MNDGMSPETISVVIPAHNEAGTIGHLLAGLHPGVLDGRLEVVVVANGCTDDTADRARAFAGVKVVEIERGHKPTAMNEGERHLSSFPRFFVDADTVFGASDLTVLAGALDAPDVMAVAPALKVDARRSSWIVRSYCRIWERLPNVAQALSSRGCFGVSADGRRRWSDFPDLVNDDRFVHTRFTAEERSVVDTVVSVVTMPRSARAVIQRRSRVDVGLDQLTEVSHRRADIHSNWAWLAVVRRDPRLVFDVPAYVGLTLAAKIWATRRRHGSTSEVWASGRPERARHG